MAVGANSQNTTLKSTYRIFWPAVSLEFQPSGVSAYSLTSLHSGARDADILLISEGLGSIRVVICCCEVNMGNIKAAVDDGAVEPCPEYHLSEPCLSGSRLCSVVEAADSDIPRYLIVTKRSSCSDHHQPTGRKVLTLLCPSFVMPQLQRIRGGHGALRTQPPQAQTGFASVACTLTPEAAHEADSPAWYIMPQ